MANVKIRQLGEHVSTIGLHMGGGPERRKLEPGEVVSIPEDFFEKDDVLLDALMASGHLELTADEVTRPLDYADYREARLCSPTFKSRGPDESEESAQARESVSERLKLLPLQTPEITQPKKVRSRKKTVSNSVATA